MRFFDMECGAQAFAILATRTHVRCFQTSYYGARQLARRAEGCMLRLREWGIATA